MNKALAVTGALLCAVLAASCFSVTDTDSHSGCTVVTSNLWNSNVRFQLSHQDPRSCPLGADLGTQVSTGGIVQDLTASYPLYGNAAYLSVDVKEDAIQFSQTYSSCVYTPLGYVGASFNWSPPQTSDPNSRLSLAQGYVTYNAGYNPDYTCFAVDLRDNPTDALARININYFGTQWRMGPAH